MVFDNALGRNLGYIHGCQFFGGEEEKVELIGFITLRAVYAGKDPLLVDELGDEGLITSALPGVLITSLLDLIPAETFHVTTNLVQCFVHSLTGLESLRGRSGEALHWRSINLRN